MISFVLSGPVVRMSNNESRVTTGDEYDARNVL